MQDAQTLFWRDRTLGQMSENIPITYVPTRHTIFLSFGLAWTESLNADRISLASTL